MDRQASLIVQWQLVGFIHGVMNTDNMAISGETIDYGPCAFMDAYHPETVFSSIDHAGRYAYGNQPAIGLWNLARFAESLLVLLDDDPAQGVELATEVLSQYTAIFDRYWLMGMRKKLGLETTEEGDRELVQELLDWMQAAGADFTNTFHDLSSGRELEGDVYREPRFQDWYPRWRQRVDREGKPPSATLSLMQGVNPCVIPRNHRVEEALSAAAEGGDLSPMRRLWEVLSRPFDRSRDCAEYQLPPPPGQAPYRTFCGT
jgi:serine/tyrosine/threonine adenylyltransferase